LLRPDLQTENTFKTWTGGDLRTMCSRKYFDLRTGYSGNFEPQI
jgi:hypothetical protein